MSIDTKDLILFGGQVLQKVRTSPIYTQATEYRNIEGGDTVLVMNCDHEAKHDDLLLLSLKNRGTPQKTIAQVFGKSDTWVTQNLQRLGAIDPPKPRAEAAEPQTGQMTMNDVIAKAENWNDIVAIPNSEFHGQANRLWRLLAKASHSPDQANELLRTKFPGRFRVEDFSDHVEGRLRFTSSLFDVEEVAIGLVDDLYMYLRTRSNDDRQLKKITYLGEVNE